MTQERVAYVNGEIVPESRASVSISDRGFILGDAVFDTTRTFGHEIFRLDEHLDRLYESLKWMRIDPQMPKDEMAGLTMDVLERNLPTVEERDDIWVTQRVTRGLRLAGGDIQGLRQTGPPSSSSASPSRSRSAPTTTATECPSSRRPSGARRPTR